MKKNCYNCKFLEWCDDGGSEYPNDNSGYICNKREYKCASEEDKHLAQLENHSYLEKAKLCCELKPITSKSSGHEPLLCFSAPKRFRV